MEERITQRVNPGGKKKRSRLILAMEVCEVK
jgi:hypothetical protein